MVSSCLVLVGGKLSNFETSTEELKFIVHEDFLSSFRDHLFNTAPDYFNSESTGTIVDYFIQFTTNTALFNSKTELINIGSEPVISSSTVVSGDEQYYLKELLSEKIKIPLEAVNLSTGTNAHVLYTASNPELLQIKTTNNKAQSYLNATTLITRYDSATDLAELLFVSSGTNMSMTNDVFLREVRSYVTPEFYDETNTNPQPSGWGYGLVNSTSVNRFLENENDEIIDTTKKIEILNDLTRTNLITYGTAVPNVQIGNSVSTFEQSDTGKTMTASDYLFIEFDDIKLDVLNNNLQSRYSNEAIVLFRCDAENKPSGILAKSTLKTDSSLVGKTPASILSKITLVLHWSDLVII